MSISWRAVFRVLAWTSLLALAVMTIGPIAQRPETPLPASLERLIAWTFAGIIFAKAYADHLALILLMLVGAAGLFELAQVESLVRHGRMADFALKAIGSLVGIGSVRIVHYLRSAR